MKKVIFVAATLILRTAIAGTPLSTQPDGLGGAIDESLMNEVKAASDRSLEWLAQHQKEDGSWSNSDYPAITALCTWAFVRGTHPQRDEVIAKAVGYMKSCVQPDGGIYRDLPGRKGGGLSNYNTAICMTTLHATGTGPFALSY